MVIRNRKSVKDESKKEVVKCYIQKPHNFEVYFGRSENPEKDWLDFQKYVIRRNPIKKRVRIFIKALADDFQLKPQVVAYLVDGFRGYSPKMQLSMFSTLHDYICYGDLITTGVAHVDKQVKEMLQRIYNNK